MLLPFTPVWDVAQTLKLVAKVAIFLYFFNYFSGEIDTIISVLTNIYQTAFSFLGDIPSVDFGCFSTKIGLVDFLNNVIDVIYTAATLYLTSVVTVLSYTFGIKMFSIFIKV